MSKIRIGLVGLWFERGNAYLTAGLREMLLPHFEPYVYARTGIIVTHQGRTYHQESAGRWDVPNVHRISGYDIDPGAFADWVVENQLSAVIWNEETNHALINRVRVALVDRKYLSPVGKPCSQIAYLDWVGSAEWIAGCKTAYDHLLCATHRTKELMAAHGVTAHYFQWSTDLDLFRPSPRHSRLLEGDDRGFLFFHNAGWGGTNWRKGTTHVLSAWVAAFGSNGGKTAALVPGAYRPRLLLHTQKPVAEYSQGFRKIVESDQRIKVVEGTVSAPGLYHMGMVYVGPSRLEGLGLTLPEALACGMHLITTDSPPMNEHGDSSCATYLPVVSTSARGDQCAFPQVDISHTALAEEMLKWARRTKEQVWELCVEGRKYAESLYDVRKNSKPFCGLVERLLT